MATAAGGSGAPAPTGFERWGRFLERLRAFHRDIERRVPHVSEVTSLVIARYQAPDFQIHVAGGPMAEATLNAAIRRDILVFVAASIGVISLLLHLLFRRLSGAALPLLVVLRALLCTLVSMIPNLVPVILTLGLMGWIGFPLDISTMMIGAILLGIPVDDTIHFMHVFYRYHALGYDAADAIARTLQTTGRAMFFTSVVLAAGFFVQMLATVDNLSHTGALMGFAVAVALLADVLLAPALMVMLEPRMAGGGSPAYERRRGE